MESVFLSYFYLFIFFIVFYYFLVASICFNNLMLESIHDLIKLVVNFFVASLIHGSPNVKGASLPLSSAAL